METFINIQKSMSGAWILIIIIFAFIPESLGKNFENVDENFF